MFIELLQCSGEEESVCPYCHSYFNVEVMKSENRYYGPRFVTKNSFRCKCKTCEHLIFVDTVSEDTKDGYLWNKFIYVFADEWMQHQSVGDEVQYCTELNEVYINNIVTNEDELWLHQKYKEEYNPYLNHKNFY